MCSIDYDKTTHKNDFELNWTKKIELTKEMLSRDCDGCSQFKACNKRYHQVGKGGKVYCPDGTAHLLDEGAEIQIAPLNEEYVKQNR